MRGARPQDLPGVALMHGRCSAKSLLDRYRTGGRAPAIIVLDRHLRDPLSFVVTAENGRIVALSRVAPDATHQFGSGEIAHARRGQLAAPRRRPGTVAAHCRRGRALAGYRQLIAYPGTTASTIQRLMAGIGTTRMMTDDSDICTPR